uniref:Uncharacterized protein n=1 Tax=Globodera rostochiensis TaxID=31243 RepID=A0A914IAR6_GLORO
MATLSFCLKWPKSGSHLLEKYMTESLPHQCKLCNKIAAATSNGDKWLQKLDGDNFSLLKFCMDEIRSADVDQTPSEGSHHQQLFACHGFTSDKKKLRETLEAISKNEIEFCNNQKYCQMF